MSWQRKAERCLFEALGGNRRLALCAASKRDVWLLDQEMLVQGFAGAYWDDAFTATPHHSAISSWSWVTLKAGVTDDPFDSTKAAAALPPVERPDIGFVDGFHVGQPPQRRHVAHGQPHGAGVRPR